MLRKFILLSTLLISLSGFSQLAPVSHKIKLNLPTDNKWDHSPSKEVKMSTGLFLGGLVFTAAGFLTPITYTGKGKEAPIYKQPRHLMVGTGLSLLTIGIAFKIGGN